MWVAFKVVTATFFSKTPSRNLFVTKGKVEKIVVNSIKSLQGINTEAVTARSRFKDIGLDSLTQIEMYALLGEQFKIDLTEENLETIKSVQDIVNIILSRVDRLP